MKIAYIILVHESPKLLERLITALNDNTKNVDFIVHLDAKTNFTEFEEFSKSRQNVHFIPKRVNVQWAGFSMVKAVLLLFKYALEHSDFDRLVLLSGVDYPIASNAAITRFFKQHKDAQFINSVIMPHPHKPIWRITKYHLEGGTVRGSSKTDKLKKKWNDRFMNLSFDRNYLKVLPKKVLCGGSTWFALTRDCVSDILQFIKNNKRLVRYFKYTAHPDEMFFQTAIMNLPKKHEVLPSLTYTDWSQPEPPYPANISHQHVDDFKNGIFTDNGYNQTDYFFVRKFDENELTVLDAIDQKLRGS